MTDYKNLCDLIEFELTMPDGNGFSFVRYGDGEAMFLNQDLNFHDVEYVTKRQWGYTPNDTELQLIRSQMVEAYRSADIVGLPTQRHLERLDTWGISMDIFNRVVGQQVSAASIDAAYEMLTSGLLHELLNGIDSLVTISGRDVQDALVEKFKIREIHSFIVAPEMKFTSKYKGNLHYPDQFNAVKKWVQPEYTPVKGKLCLVGAGILGKIYCHWIKQAGGIAVDIGGVFDAWAGLRTRGKGRGVDVEDLTYKL